MVQVRQTPRGEQGAGDQRGQVGPREQRPQPPVVPPAGTGGLVVRAAAETREETDRALARLDPQLRAVMAAQFTEAQMSFLLQKTPRREVRYREGPGGKRLAYVEHAYVTEKLNQIFGFNWDLEVIEQHLIGNEAIVKVRLTVRTAQGGPIVKEAYGGQLHQPNTELANTIKGACSDGLKKAASLLGIGIDLYRHDDTPGPAGPSAERRRVYPSDGGSPNGGPVGSTTMEGEAGGSAPVTLAGRARQDTRQDYSWFWGQARQLGLNPEQVHARLGVRNLKELETQGLTLADILARLRQSQPAA